MNKSLNQKLLKFQQNVEAVKKDSKNPHFKNNYFDINSLLEAVLPELNEVGLVLTQIIDAHENGLMQLVTTVTCAESGEFVTGKMWLPAAGKPQDYGSAVTYYRRYSLQSMLGIQGEDDDGNTASSIPPRTTSFSGGKFGGKS